MAKKIKPGPSPPQILPIKGIELLNGQIEKGNKLLSSRPLTKDEYISWELLTRNYLEKTFGMNSPNVTSVMNVGKCGSFQMNAGDKWWEQHDLRVFKVSFGNSKVLLNS